MLGESWIILQWGGRELYTYKIKSFSIFAQAFWGAFAIGSTTEGIAART